MKRRKRMQRILARVMAVVMALSLLPFTEIGGVESVQAAADWMFTSDSYVIEGGEYCAHPGDTLAFNWDHLYEDLALMDSILEADGNGTLSFSWKYQAPSASTFGDLPAVCYTDDVSIIVLPEVNCIDGRIQLILTFDTNVLYSPIIHITAPPAPLSFEDNSAYDYGDLTLNQPITEKYLTASGGTGEYSYALKNNPSWLHIDEATGRLYGTPDKLATVSSAVKATCTSGDETQEIEFRIGRVISNIPRTEVDTMAFTGFRTAFPAYGATVNESSLTAFTVAISSSASYYHLAYSMTYIQKWDGAQWVKLEGGSTIDDGTYRAVFQARIDGENGLLYELSPSFTNEDITFDGETCTKVATPVIDIDYSCVYVYSPEVKIHYDPNPLIFEDNILYDIGAPKAGVFYRGQKALEASGGTPPYQFSITGTKPAWISIDADGYLCGTPTAPDANVYNPSIVCRDSEGREKSIGIAISPVTVSQIVITNVPSFGNWTVGEACSKSFTAAYGTGNYTYTVVSGTLPGWLTLETDGQLHGTPTTVDLQEYDVTVRCDDGITTAETNLHVGKVKPLYEVSIYSNTELDYNNITVGEPIQEKQLYAQHGTGTYTFFRDSTGRCPWLTVSADGKISGTAPDTIDSNIYEITVSVYDGLTTKTDSFKVGPIVPVDMSACTVTLNPTEFPYTGSPQQPAVTVTYKGVTLTEDTDYTLTWPTSYGNYGMYTVQVTGKGKFAGTVSRNYKINKAAISDCNITLNPAAFTYNGEPQKPAVKVKFGDKDLTEGTDYKVTYPLDSDLRKADTFQVEVTGMGNFDGAIQKDYQIKPASLSDCTVTLDQTSFTYNRNPRKPATVTVTYDGMTLHKDLDYALTWPAASTDVGTYKVKLTGMGNYSGEVQKEYTIDPAGLSDCTINLDQTSFTFNGTAQKPAVVVQHSGETLTEGTDYTLTLPATSVSAGSYEVTITGKGNYTGTEVKCYTINPGPPVSSWTAMLSQDRFVYNKGEQRPEVIVKTVDNTPLIENEHYTLTLPDASKNVGSYSVTVTGKGDFTGTQTLTYTIDPGLPVSTWTAALSQDRFVYNGTDQRPRITVQTVDDAPLTEGEDYTIAWPAASVNAGSYSVTITGKGGYTGTLTKTYTIAQAGVKDVKIALSGTALTYNGQVQTPGVSIKNSSNQLLAAGRDYTVTYTAGRKDVGGYEANIVLKGNYSGTAVVGFTINPKGAAIKAPSRQKKAFTAKWKKQTGKMSKARITGYQLRYSTDPTMKTGKTVTVKGYKKTSRKISKLKAKTTYYVQVRTYLKAAGKTYYSDWSAMKKVKTR